MPSVLALPLVYAAIVAKLKADATLTALLAGGAGSVYNVAPSGAAFPYVEVGSGTEIDFNTMGPDGLPKWGANCTVQLTGRTQSSGAGSDLPVLTIMSRVKAVLVGQPLTVAGFPSVAVSLDVVPPLFTDVVDNRPTRTQAVIVRVQVHEGAR
jgi:hypothetical protein